MEGNLLFMINQCKSLMGFSWKERAHSLIQIAILVPYSEGISWWAEKNLKADYKKLSLLRNTFSG